MKTFAIWVGIGLILLGIFMPVPGGALSTYESDDGDKAENYVFDDKYSSIDEYVGGDAYNYIIGATLVAGKITGTMTTKAICCVGGAICICLGVTLAAKDNGSGHIVSVNVEERNREKDSDSDSGSSSIPVDVMHNL